jgi:hypothetical protein
MSSTTARLAPVVTLLAHDYNGRLVCCDGIVYYLTDCCQASGKGGASGVVCRACYRPVADQFGDGWLVSDTAAWSRYALGLVGSEVGANAQLLMGAALSVMAAAQAARPTRTTPARRHPAGGHPPSQGEPPE